MNNRIDKFKAKLREFYKNNKRDFPWRKTDNPYKILVSEIMLQQTQTGRVIEKYARFLKAFPTFSHLAHAPQNTVLKEWQGLGYNRRALYLQRTARTVCEKYNGILPSLKEELVTLPGVGPNTAGAVIAFAFNKPAVFIETNIRRVFIHEFFREKEGVADKELYPFIEASLDTKNPRDFYYALMDYGVYLGKAGTNPNRKSKHYKTQTTFEGSVRQMRGKILKLLINGEKDTLLLAKEFENRRFFNEALRQLIGEEFIEKKGRKITLKS